MDFPIKGFLRNRSDYYSDIRNEKNEYQQQKMRQNISFVTFYISSC
jgi:hypothetical protein